MLDQLEEWKVIEENPKYEISNLGRVRKIANGYILKPNIFYGLYYLISLRNGKTQKLYSIHRLVANAFIPNPLKKREVNHIDGNKHNNNVNNLEWATRKENAIHSIKNGLQTKEQLDKAIMAITLKNSKPILQIKNGEIIKRYPSVRAAARELGLNHSNISTCAAGKTKNAYGFEWRYEL